MKIETSIVINVGDKRRQMNHFGNGGGGNYHTLLIRGDMLFVNTVDEPYNNRLHHLRAVVVGDGHGCFGSVCCFIVHSSKKYYVK